MNMTHDLLLSVKNPFSRSHIGRDYIFTGTLIKNDRNEPIDEDMFLPAVLQAKEQLFEVYKLAGINYTKEVFKFMQVNQNPTLRDAFNFYYNLIEEARITLREFCETHEFDKIETEVETEYRFYNDRIILAITDHAICLYNPELDDYNYHYLDNLHGKLHKHLLQEVCDEKV